MTPKPRIRTKILRNEHQQVEPSDAELLAECKRVLEEVKAIIKEQEALVTANRSPDERPTV